MDKGVVRDDYKEFLELIIIFLGGNLPKGNKFHPPGATHHARWMSKAIYTLKIFMFRDQITLRAQEKNGIRDVCLFLIFTYAKAWFRSSFSIEAPRNDLQLIKTSIEYSKINVDVSNIIIKKISNHLWYLADESIGLSFFDEKVTVEEKRKMVAALNKQQAECKRFIANEVEIKRDFLNKSVSDFVSSNTLTFFHRFDICTEFLTIDPANWSENDDYNDGFVKCRSIRVVNDAAERFVQLFGGYNLLLTKEESQKQYIMQVVKEYETKHPSAKKYDLK